jgi:hypothetical protein
MSALLRRVDAGGRTYHVLPQPPYLFTVLVWARVIDRATGQPLRQPVSMMLDVPDRATRRAAPGVVAIAGDPARLLPGHPAVAVALGATVQSTGYQSARVTFSVPAAAALPFQAADVVLDPTPVTVLGRVTTLAADAPLPGARVSADAAAAPFAVLLRTPLRHAHAAGALVRGVTLADAGPARALLSDALRGDEQLHLDVRSGLGAGDMLRLGHADAGDCVAIAQVLMPANQPGAVMLSAALQRRLSAGTAVRALNVAPLGAARTLAAVAGAGGALVRLDAAPDPAWDALLIDTGAAAEVLNVGTLTDGAGFYRFSGVSGVANLALRAEHPAHATQTRQVAVYPTNPNTTVDFKLN